MHELSICDNILKIVKSELTSRQLTAAVEKVVFKAGRLNAIIPTSLEFHFDMLKKNDPQLAEAKLEVVELPLRARCPKCDRIQELGQPIFVCEKCGGPLAIDSGQEMFVDSISLRD